MPKDANLGQITNAPSDIAKCRPVSCAAVGDAKLVLNQLIEAARKRLGEKGREAAVETNEEIKKLKQEFLTNGLTDCFAMTPVLSPYRVIHEMNTLFDKKRLWSHTTQVILAIKLYLSMRPHTQRLSRVGQIDASRLLVGNGLGGKLAKPDWLSVNFIGDAGFGQTANDFETAVRSNLPILTVLVNNGVMGGYGAYMPEAVEKYQSSSLGGDYTGMAIAMGGHAERIEKASDVRARSNRLKRPRKECLLFWNLLPRKNLCWPWQTNGECDLLPGHDATFAWVGDDWA